MKTTVLIEQADFKAMVESFYGKSAVCECVKVVCFDNDCQEMPAPGVIKVVLEHTEALCNPDGE